MSAIFGYFGCFHDEFKQLSKELVSIWGPKAVKVKEFPVEQVGVGLIQQTTFFPLNEPEFDPVMRRLFIVQGYLWEDQGFPLTKERARLSVRKVGGSLIENTAFELPESWGGLFTLATFDFDSKRLIIRNDISGIFPLYYALGSDGLLFSSHSQPLAKAIKARIDPTGVIQQTVFHYTIGNKTLYQNILRLNPGETLVFSLESNQLRLHQPTKIYSNIQSYHSDKEALEALWSDYLNGAEQLSKPAGTNGILLSGGFDTRLVLLGLMLFGKPIDAITFGDNGNHEVDIAKRVASVSEIKQHICTPVPDCHPSPERIARLIARAESVNFAPFETAAELLKNKGAVSASTGYGGETMFGGQAFSLLGSAWSRNQRFKLLMTRSLGFPIDFSMPLGSRTLSTFLDQTYDRHNRTIQRTRNLFSQSWQQNVDLTLQVLRDELREEFRRITYSNPETIQQLCERFWIEHHVLKHFGRAEFTIDSVIPVVLPTMHHSFYTRCSNLPPERKVDHGIYLQFARKYYGDLAKIPTSNIPLNLKFPQLLLWSARALRAIYDQRQVRRLVESKGIKEHPRHGWANFEIWMRQGSFLQDAWDMISTTTFSSENMNRKLGRIMNWEERVYSGQEILTYITVSKLTEGF